MGPRAWPLIGRGEELRFVRAALLRPRGPAGVVLAGSPGVGKTRLAREALALLGRHGAPARWATATASARALPLGAFAGLIGGPEGADPAQMIREAAAALRRSSGPGRVTVAVDDAHLLDDQSAMLLHHLVLERMARVVVTIRSGEPAPDAVTALWKDAHLDRLEVQPLSEPETVALLESVLGGQLDSGSAGRIWALTRGNALYLRHLVDNELAGGRLRQSGAVWRWTGQPVMAAGLADLVAVRMGRLSEPVQEVVDVLALCEPLDTGVLARLVEPAALEEAESVGVVGVEGAGPGLSARLAHPLYGEVRRARLGLLRARRLRGRIVTALSGSPEEALRRAVLSLDSDLAPDAQLLADGAARAAQLYDYPLAERLGRAAVAVGAGYEAQAVVASAVLWYAPLEDGHRELRQLVEIATSDAEYVKAVVALVQHLAWRDTRPDEALAELDRAEAHVGEHGPRLVLRAQRAMLDAQLGRVAIAARVASAVPADPAAPDEAQALAGMALVTALAGLGAEGLDAAAERAFAACDRSPQLAYLRGSLGVLLAIGQRLAGRLTAAADTALRLRELVRGHALVEGIGAAALADVELARGRVAGAVRTAREAWAALEPFGVNGGWPYYALIVLTRALAVAGETDAAREAGELMHQRRHPTLVFPDPDRLLALSALAAAEGSITEALARAHEAASGAGQVGQHAHEVLALQAAVCLGDRTVADRLADLATRVDGPRARAAAAHARALATGDGDALDAASARWEQVGDLLAAVDAAAQASAVHHRRGRRGAAQLAAARAHRLAESCDGVRTPALATALRPLPLTEREREIVSLAARGLSNAEIAARLVVSVRTVEGHIYRASTKLGISSRAEFAPFLGLDAPE